MLKELRIENFAIIQSLVIDFEDGLSTFTGETGAGKSILLDALVSIVGGRTDANMIRSGADKALVEGAFRLPQANRAAILEILEREELLDDPNYVTLARELRMGGRNIARVNGRSVSVSLLRELGSYLIDIHGQSEHLSLLNVRQHLPLLDRYAANDSHLDTYRQTYRKLLALRRELNELRESERDAYRRTDLLTFQVQEIDSAHLQPDEEDELRQERDRLANAEALASLAQQALLLLEEGDAESPAISDLFGKVVSSLSGIARVDPSQSALYDQVEEIFAGLSDLGREMRDYLEGIEFNPRRLEQTEERLEMILTLKRKYGGSIEAVISFGENARAQLDSIAHAGERIAELEQQEQGLLEQLSAQAQALSERRSQAADALGKGIENELDDLSMAGARFTVDIQHRPDPNGLKMNNGSRVGFDDSGFDQVEFLIAPNPGEGFKPLVKIASGGETSRLMLALKNVLARADNIPTLVFDEIDQGIGGRVGSVVGEKLWQLGRRHQVLCVTHLPQLAAFGDQHYRVRKLVESGRTQTQVERLVDSPRLDELALMLGALSAANRVAAEETLETAKRRALQLAEH